LSGRETAVRLPSEGGNEAKNQWAALCAAHEMASKIPESQVLVGREGGDEINFIFRLI